MTKTLRRNRACCFNRCVADTHRHSMKCWRLPHYLIRPLHKFNILYFLGIKDLFEFVSGGAAARILDEEKITKLLGMKKMYKICGGRGINTKQCPPPPPPIIRYPLNKCNISILFDFRKFTHMQIPPRCYNKSLIFIIAHNDTLMQV